MSWSTYLIFTIPPLNPLHFIFINLCRISNPTEQRLTNLLHTFYPTDSIHINVIKRTLNSQNFKQIYCCRIIKRTSKISQSYRVY